MKVTGWTDQEDKKYIQIHYPYVILNKNKIPKEQIYEMWNVVVKEVKEKGYRFTGDMHQNCDTGTPIIDDKYIFCLSQRSWGELMRQAHNLPDPDGMGYITWAWVAPQGETITLPKVENNA